MTPSRQNAGGRRKTSISWSGPPREPAFQCGIGSAPEYTYVRAGRPDDDNVYILVKDRVAAVLGGNDGNPGGVERIGSIGTGYEQLCPSCLYRAIMPLRFMAPSLSPPRTVQGIVHIAPAFSEDDYQLGRRYDLPSCNRWDQEGSSHGDQTLGSQFVREADRISSSTSRRRKLFSGG